MGRRAAPQPLPLSDPSDVQGHDDPPVSETASIQPQVVSPAESRSPRSPRSSPFHSRFSPIRSQAGKQVQQQQQQQQQQKQQQKQQQRRHLQQPTEDAGQRLTNKPSREDPSTAYPPISSAFEPAPASHPPRAPSSHKPNEGKKPTKTGFFHFNKASRPMNQYQPHNMYQNVEPRSQTVSRGSDATSTSRYGGTLERNLIIRPTIST